MVDRGRSSCLRPTDKLRLLYRLTLMCLQLTRSMKGFALQLQRVCESDPAQVRIADGSNGCLAKYACDCDSRLTVLDAQMVFRWSAVSGGTPGRRPANGR